MTDIVTYCDVNTCEDCPRYGDDCDGDKRVEHTDLISRADAIKAVASITMSIHLSEVICDKLLALPSAEANPTVVRCKTMIPYGDFREWAKRIREDNPNVIVIPCDAEVVSADAVQGWRIGKPTEQGKYMVTLDSFGHKHIDLFYYGKPMMPNRKVRGRCWYRSDDEWGDVVYDDTDILAWMPLPKPYREESEVEE